MAKVLGESGRYVSQEAVNQSRRFRLLVILVLAVLALIEGFVLASFIPARLIPAWLRLLISPVSIVLLREQTSRSSIGERPSFLLAIRG